MTGTIKTLRVDKGFGFIRDAAGKEVFFHASAIYGEGIDNLREGDGVGAQILVASGADQRIVMAGSGISWHLLAMHLIARFAAPQQAMQVARMKLMDLNAASPVAYASLKYTGRNADPLVTGCQHWAALNYAAVAPVTQMVALSGLPERTFKRRFTLATGMSPLAYVHALRIEEAKQMLESSDQPVEAIALEVGYQDAAFFGRLFRRKVSMSPAQYRGHFGKLARRLAAGMPT